MIPMNSNYLPLMIHIGKLEKHSFQYKIISILYSPDFITGDTLLGQQHFAATLGLT